MTTNHGPRTTAVAIVGGGIIGMALAWRLAERGRSVTVVERGRAGRGASWAAGGMLASAAEVQFEEAEIYRFGRESLRRWPAFARALEAASGHDVGYRDEGTLVVADDRDAAEALQRLFRFQQAHDVPVTWLTAREALEIEPFLSPKLAAAVFSPEDHQVDNRAAVEALRSVLIEHPNATLREGVAVRAVEPGERPAAVTDDGERVEAHVVVLAAGAWSRGIEGIEPVPVRPLKGQMLALQMARPFDLRHVVRSPHAYLVPKADGRLVIGATSEEMGFDTAVTGGGLYRLLEGAVEAVPGVEELAFVEAWAGLRPASRDHAPLLGESGAPGVVLATGHYRHGILFAPLTADELALEIDARLRDGGETSDWLAPFSPQRLNS